MKKTTYFIFCFILISLSGKAQKPLLQWVKNMGGSGVNSSAPFIAVDNANNNVYSTGYFTGTVDFDPGNGLTNLTSAGGQDAYIVKLDATGNFVWAKSFGGSGSDASYCVAIDATGNIYLTGNYTGTVDFDPGTGTMNLSSSGAADIFISKLDASGNLIWAKSIGGTNSEYSNSIAVDASGNIIATGNYAGTADFDPNAGVVNLTSAGADDVFVVKLDGTGNLIWAKSMGGIGSEWGDSVFLDALNNVYTAGNYAGTADFDPGAGTANLTSAGMDDIFVSKLDASGNYVWSKSMGGTLTDFANGLAVDASGIVYTIGNYEGTADFDPNAGTFNLTTVGAGDIFISKLDASGNFIWAKGMGSALSDYGGSVVIDATNNVYSTGFFAATTDFDPGAGTNTIISAGGNDVFISKLDASGNFVWAKSIGGSGTDNAGSIFVDNVGGVYTAGKFSGTVDFDPNTGIKNVTSIGTGDAFIHRMIQCNLKSISGTVSGSAGGNVILYQYIPALSKWDSVAFTPYSSSYSFGVTDSSSYVLKAVPTATNEQVTYFGNAISWQSATVVNHGCMANSTNTIAIVSFTNIGTGTGSMSGKILEEDGFGKKPSTPGNPIGGIIVKGGRNPSGQMFTQTKTDPINGTYTLTGIPNGTNYFILVDIPGLDTNLTYHVDLVAGNNQLTGLDFTVDSIYVNPIPNLVGLHDLNVREHQLLVFPNPTSHDINVNYVLNENSTVSIELFDIAGRLVKTLLPLTRQTIDTYKKRFELADLNSGIYFIKLKINDNESIIKLCLTN
ncbi:MAG: hypothetical protein K0S53_318 [Bacteroidetes bacterium]|jgi:hypothetical protein|nr:hypothetical protein [Bacteroidota bacterium]MDF2452043.1 hypothetical protein [Bacteroidota bacterium]